MNFAINKTYQWDKLSYDIYTTIFYSKSEYHEFLLEFLQRLMVEHGYVNSEIILKLVIHSNSRVSTNLLSSLLYTNEIENLLFSSLQLINSTNNYEIQIKLLSFISKIISSFNHSQSEQFVNFIIAVVLFLFEKENSQSRKQIYQFFNETHFLSNMIYHYFHFLFKNLFKFILPFFQDLNKQYEIA
jgi:hypothetical protein